MLSPEEIRSMRAFPELGDLISIDVPGPGTRVGNFWPGGRRHDSGVVTISYTKRR